MGCLFENIAVMPTRILLYRFVLKMKFLLRPYSGNNTSERHNNVDLYFIARNKIVLKKQTK
jgi:hypothetical protein